MEKILRIKYSYLHWNLHHSSLELFLLIQLFLMSFNVSRFLLPWKLHGNKDIVEFNYFFISLPTLWKCQMKWKVFSFSGKSIIAWNLITCESMFSWKTINWMIAIIKWNWYKCNKLDFLYSFYTMNI